jgi:hypothetical protein
LFRGRDNRFGSLFSPILASGDHASTNLTKQSPALVLTRHQNRQIHTPSTATKNFLNDLLSDMSIQLLLSPVSLSVLVVVLTVGLSFNKKKSSSYGAMVFADEGR